LTDEQLPPDGDPSEDRPPEGPPTDPNASPESPPDAPTPDADDIEDPFERESIRYFGEDSVLGVTLDGPKVGRRNIDVFTFGEFLAQLDRVVRGLTASLQGITLAAAGRIPRPPDAAPWRMGGLAFTHSATIDFELGEPEATRISDTGEVTSPTLEAIAELIELIALDADSAVEVVQRHDDRIGTDFSHLLAILADNGLVSRWRGFRAAGPVEVSSAKADNVRNALRAELPPVTSLVTVSGFLFRLDAKKNDFKIQPEDEGPAITGSYDDTLTAELRDAWSHRVVAELLRTEHRYAYATAPFRVEHALRRVVRTLGKVEGEQGSA